MRNIRLIARLDIKGPNLIKGVHLEGLRVVGDPYEFARKYYESGIDELLYMDSVASLYNRNSLGNLVKRTAKDIFIPITVGGGIRSVDDVQEMLRSGADKVAINTAAVKNPNLISQIANKFGSQCMVLSIEAKRNPDGSWEPYTDNGREHTGLDVLEWSQKAAELGAGEILLTSIDQEGTKKGFDIELARTISENISLPVVISGGMGSFEDLSMVVRETGVSGVAFARVLHYNEISLHNLRDQSIQNGINIRKIAV